MSELNPRQEKFVSEYLKTLNLTQSAIKAGYSPQSAHTQGYRLLKNEKVANYLNEVKSKVIDDNVLSANEILHLLSNAAVGEETEMKEVVTKRGEYVKNPDTGKYNIIYNESVEMVEVPIKISDRLKARDLLGKYHTLFTDKHELTGDTPVIINVGEWDDEAEEEVGKKYPNRTKIIDDVPFED
ncbi:terminase small subunit [Staphylococcus ureilyticus]|uniref:terminase small subunit n=1 Tax=Staphylococcus ureilyticus TaxID=94138 RepID=UPI0021D179F8|nr:terminase small subunit [Staphylococcus ureilyticus]UXS59930.1 terminase small subunit [Staphylococcus ureilyticus]